MFDSSTYDVIRVTVIDRPVRSIHIPQHDHMAVGIDKENYVENKNERMS